MQRNLPTAVLEFLARTARARIDPFNLWRRAEKVGYVAKRVDGKEPLRLKITVDLRRARRRTHNQRFAKLRAYWIFIRSHLGVGIVFVG